MERELVFDFLGYGIHPSRCHLKIVEHEGLATVTLTELMDNPGTAVTNAIEDLATEVFRQFLTGYALENIRWIEHYPERRFGKEMVEESFDEVTLTWDGRKFRSPQWKRMRKAVND